MVGNKQGLRRNESLKKTVCPGFSNLLHFRTMRPLRCSRKAFVPWARIQSWLWALEEAVLTSYHTLYRQVCVIPNQLHSIIPIDGLHSSQRSKFKHHSNILNTYVNVYFFVIVRDWVEISGRIFNFLLCRKTWHYRVWIKLSENGLSSL